MKLKEHLLPQDYEAKDEIQLEEEMESKAFETTDAFANTKIAYVWAYPAHPYTIGYPGVVADLFFSSPEKFKELLGREPDEFDTLVRVWVPKYFDNWDYIPEDY